MLYSYELTILCPRADDHGESELRADPLSFGAPEESHSPVRNPQPSSRRFRAPLVQRHIEVHARVGDQA